MISILCRVRIGRRSDLYESKIGSLQAALPVRRLLAPFLSSTSSIGCLCPLRGLALESTEHLFMRCQIARFAWHESPWPLHMELVGDISFVAFVKHLVMPHWFFGVVLGCSPLCCVLLLFLIRFGIFAMMLFIVMLVLTRWFLLALSVGVSVNIWLLGTRCCLLPVCFGFLPLWGLLNATLTLP